MSYLLTKSLKTSQPQHFIIFDTEAYPEQILLSKQSKSFKPSLNPDLTLINQHILSFGYAFYYELIDGEYIKKDELFFSHKIEDIENYNKIHYTKYTTPQQVFTDYYLRRTKKGHPLYLFAHNIAYDIRHILDEKLLKESDYKLKVGISKNVFIYKYGKKNYDVIFLSTTNYFRTSLKELGKIFKLDKLEFEINKKGSEEIKNISERAKTYCYRDVEILDKVVINLINFTKDKCKFSYTIASTAFNIYRHKFYDENIRIHHLPDIEFFERQAYYGGRTECFRIGLYQNIYKLDINSMYSDSMLNHDYPIEYIGMIKHGSKEQLLKYINDSEKEYLIIANVTVNLKDSKIPYRNTENDKLLYPIGKFSTFLCQPEIELLTNDEIIGVKEILIYKKAQIFNNFVSYFYDKRLEYKGKICPNCHSKNIKELIKDFKYECNDCNGIIFIDDVMQYFCKTVLNSCYGKFAQKTTKDIRNYEFDGWLENGYLDYVDENDKLHKLKFIHKECFEITNEEASYNSFIPISAFVTSYARVKLYHLIQLVKPYLIYCDTDSLLVTLEGFEILSSLNWIDKQELGKLKKEDFLLEFECRNLKDYSSKNIDLEIEHKIKGIKRDSVKKAISNNEDISTKNVWEINRFIGYDESLRYFNLLVGDLNEIKILKRTYEKGIVDKKTGIVYPFTLNEENNISENIIEEKNIKDVFINPYYVER
jgi:hypothetical protein